MGFKTTFLFFVLFCFSFTLQAQRAERGVLDLSAFDFNSTVADLSGEWELYTGRLLSPEDFAGNNIIPAFDNVPNSWDYNNAYPTLGYVTYRLKIKLPDHVDNIALFFPPANSAARIYMNGKLAAQTGNVSADPAIHFGHMANVILLVPETRDVDLIIQVSNYSYFLAGIVRTPSLGKFSVLQKDISLKQGVANFIVGSLVAIFIYHLFLFLLYRKGESNLYLGLICLFVALRTATMNGGSLLLSEMFTEVDMEYWKKIEFFSVYATVALFPLYVVSLFPSTRFVKVSYTFLAFAVILCIIVLFTKQPVYGSLLNLAHGALVAAFIFVIYVITTALKTNTLDAKTILWGIAASFPFILIEILGNSGILKIHFNYMVETGVLVFLLFQSYMLASRNARAYVSLQSLNLGLEENVKVRTAELTKANRVKDKLLSVISHDIKGPLNSLRAILNLFSREAISADELKQFISKIENELQRTQILFDNILTWTSTQIKGLKIKRETLTIYQLAEEHVQLFRQIADSKRLKLLNTIEPDLMIDADKNIMSLALRNLISNAIKFTEEGGSITLLSQSSGTETLIRIKDTGTGITEENVKKLFRSDTSESTTGTNQEKGTGLGLILCKEYLEAMGGDISVESTVGEGSIFTIHLPLKR